MWLLTHLINTWVIRCSQCHRIISSAAYPEKPARPGDFAICGHCWTPHKYDDKLSLKRLPKDEFNRIYAEKSGALTAFEKARGVTNFLNKVGCRPRFLW